MKSLFGRGFGLAGFDGNVDFKFFGKVGDVGAVPEDGVGWAVGFPVGSGGELLLEVAEGGLVVFLGVAAALTETDDGAGGFGGEGDGVGVGEGFVLVFLIDVEAHLAGHYVGFDGGGHG